MNQRLMRTIVCAALGGWLVGIPIDRSLGQAGGGAGAGVGITGGQNTGASAGGLGVSGQPGIGDAGRNGLSGQSPGLDQAQNRLNGNRARQGTLNDRAGNRNSQSAGGFDNRSGMNRSRGRIDNRRDLDRSGDQTDLRMDSPRRSRSGMQDQRGVGGQRRSTASNLDRDAFRDRPDNRRMGNGGADTSRGRLDNERTGFEDRASDRSDDQFNDGFRDGSDNRRIGNGGGDTSRGRADLDNERTGFEDRASDRSDDQFNDGFRNGSNNRFDNGSENSFDDRGEFSNGESNRRTDLRRDNPQRDGRSSQGRNDRRGADNGRSQDRLNGGDVGVGTLEQDSFRQVVGRLNDQRDFGPSATARSRAAQGLDRAGRQLDINRDRLNSRMGGVTRGLDIAPPPGGINLDRSVDRRSGDLSDRTRFDRDVRSGLPTGARRSGFRGLDRANEQIDLNRQRFEERTGRTNRGLDNAFERTMQNRQRFDDRFDDRLNGGFEDDNSDVNRRD
ncbi:MAG: hypothetical protein WD894_22605 [Pirellulales bacterium]